MILCGMVVLGMVVVLYCIVCVVCIIGCYIYCCGVGLYVSFIGFLLRLC